MRAVTCLNVLTQKCHAAYREVYAVVSFHLPYSEWKRSCRAWWLNHLRCSSFQWVVLIVMLGFPGPFMSERRGEPCGLTCARCRHPQRCCCRPSTSCATRRPALPVVALAHRATTKMRENNRFTVAKHSSEEELMMSSTGVTRSFTTRVEASTRNT